MLVHIQEFAYMQTPHGLQGHTFSTTDVPISKSNGVSRRAISQRHIIHAAVA
jgi:hypothetical protein